MSSVAPSPRSSYKSEKENSCNNNQSVKMTNGSNGTANGGSGGSSSTATPPQPHKPPGVNSATTKAAMEAHQYVGPYRLEKTLGKGQTGKKLSFAKPLKIALKMNASISEK